MILLNAPLEFLDFYLFFHFFFYFKRTNIAYSTVYKKIDKILEIWSNMMINSDLSINYIGSFKINQKNERIGRNPKTKEEHLIKSRKVISFKKSSKLLL